MTIEQVIAAAALLAQQPKPDWLTALENEVIQEIQENQQ